MSANTKLEKLYRSAPEGSILYQTLEIFHPVMSAPLRIFLAGEEGSKDFTLEASAPRDASSAVAHTAASFTISEPTVEQDVGNSQVNISLGLSALTAVNEILDALEADAVQFLTPIEIIYRIYEGTDTAIGPSQDPPTSLFATSIGMDSSNGVQVIASTTNNALVDTGTLYTAEDFPGLITNA